jgi:hypothetical protein
MKAWGERKFGRATGHGFNRRGRGPLGGGGRPERRPGAAPRGAAGRFGLAPAGGGSRRSGRCGVPALAGTIRLLTQPPCSRLASRRLSQPRRRAPNKRQLLAGAGAGGGPRAGCRLGQNSPMADPLSAILMFKSCRNLHVPSEARRSTHHSAHHLRIAWAEP